MKDEARFENICNPHSLEEDQTVILDEGQVTEVEVYIIWMSPKKMFSVVCLPSDANYSWRVMTMRLTPKKAADGTS